VIWSLIKHVLVLLFSGGVATVLWIQVLVQRHQDIHVPNLLGMDASQANKKTMEAQLLFHEDKRLYTFQYPINSITYQKPAAGEKISEGRRIHVWLSAGLDPEWKNNIQGKSYQEAEAYIKDQEIGQLKTHIVCGNEALQDEVLDAHWDHGAQKMHVLQAGPSCNAGWILKGIKHSNDINMLKKEAAQKKIVVKVRDQMEPYDQVTSDPLPGHMIGEGDLIVVRKRL